MSGSVSEHQKQVSASSHHSNAALAPESSSAAAAKASTAIKLPGNSLLSRNSAIHRRNSMTLAGLASPKAKTEVSQEEADVLVRKCYLVSNMQFLFNLSNF